MGTQKVPRASGHREIQSGTVSPCLSALLIMFANGKVTLKNFTVNHSQALVTASGDGLSEGVLYWEKGGLKMPWTGSQVLPVPHKTEFKSLLQVFKNFLLGVV